MNTGGMNTGGMNTGGMNTGGMNTGGMSTGGMSTGGMSTGGMSTGGMSTGGMSTGGMSTGGMSTGGMSTGGMSAGGMSTGGMSAGGMNTETSIIETSPRAPVQESVRIRAHHGVVKKLGHWTTARRFDVRASRGAVVLDLRSPWIAAGHIEIWLDIDHATVKLLVPDNAIIDDGDLRRVGRCRVKDWTGKGAPGSRRILLCGEMRGAEARVHRGGVAILSAMASRAYLADARRARREGRYPTVDHPAR